MSHPLAKQVILITGASTGIGAALARLLAHRYSGIGLALAARNPQKLDEVAHDCRQAGANVLSVPTDIAQPNQVTALTQAVLDQFGRVDALVNNAGYGQLGAVELIPPERVQNQFAVNVIGAIALIQSLIPYMRDQGGGRIINISSLGGRMAFPFGGLYSASKFALEGLSDALRMELAPFNIRVVVVEPGPVRTEFFDVVKQGVDAMEIDPLNTPYHAAYENLEGLQQQVDRQAWSSEQVAEVIIKALGDRRPRPRYVAATGGNILIFLMTKLLPTRITDLFWQRFYAIHRVAQDWKYHKQL
ncbi:MAG: SDR family oxidoreductase [Oculatellaceae cyanobacterium bins.114]|nr:SDR family oxidoreductase [Oculatellaceae cyanobacterium bins.114]